MNGMKLALSQCGTMKMERQARPEASAGRVILTVLCCAICRTDAKMWWQGHRDLVLPRVLGHEIVGVEEATGLLYTVWPGQVCTTCHYCLGGRENLCEEMRIIGFHADGGFARYVSVPRESLVSIADKFATPADLAPRIATFAEPVACVLNGFSRLAPEAGERVIIYGGGVVGMLAALACRERDCRVTVIEKNEEKIARLRELSDENQITLVKDTTAADFDLAINCCDNHIAFCLAIAKLRKGGRLSYFSGLVKNEELGTNLLNLIHYKELEVFGAYGPRRGHMVQAISFCVRQRANLDRLIERVIPLSEVEAVLPRVLAGSALKFIVDFGEACHQPVPAARSTAPASATKPEQSQLSAFLGEIIAAIKPVPAHFRDMAQHKVDRKTKPLGALGKIEELAVRLSAIQKNLSPAVDCQRMFVFAGDHGVVEEGVSAFPAKVTVQMVQNFLDGGAAINAFCRQYGIELAVVDMGVNGDFADHPLLIKMKVARGTRNFAVQPAMSRAEALLAIEHGARTFLAKNAGQRCDLVGMGEMGIGNSSSATAIICGAAGLTAQQVAGRGTGVDDRGLSRKIEVIDKALALHLPQADDALDLLTRLGGYELGGICGAILAAAASGCCVVLDGIISTASGLLAWLFCPAVKDYLVAGHKSVESGQQIALTMMGLEPVLDLELRLGEGTGAAITMNLIDLACRMIREMATFEEAGVDKGVTTGAKNGARLPRY